VQNTPVKAKINGNGGAAGEQDEVMTSGKKGKKRKAPKEDDAMEA
jgi:hypothetical protein